jgi:glutamate synthase domain-containing protein 3
MVELETVWHEKDQKLLREMIERYHRWTESERARHILEDWSAVVGRFVKVMPLDYRKSLERQRELESAQTEYTPATEEVFRG